MKRILALLLILLLILPMVAQCGGVLGGGGASSGGGGGGGSRQTSIDNLLKAVKDAKSQSNPKLEELKKLLYIEPFVTKNYDTKNFTMGLAIEPDNKTLTRNDNFRIIATVGNPNPIEIRRVLYIDLEVMEPGEKAFRKVNSVPQMIMNGEYEVVNGKNLSSTTFPELTSFSDLKRVGPVALRLHVSDGKNEWQSEALTLDIINRQPELTNMTLQAPERPRFNDPINYFVNVTDPDGDLVNVTLHLLDDKKSELRNETQITMPGKVLSFAANQYGFFDKADSGKNFTYYYTFSDGIAVNNTSIEDGPRLRKSVTIWVDKPTVTPEDANQYWWESYNFSLNMKNQDPTEPSVPVTVSLFTSTPANPHKSAGSKVVTLTNNESTVSFDVKPFGVEDANQTYSYIFEYSEYDQNQGSQSLGEGSKPLNAKLVRYELISGLGLGNILALLLLAFLASILVERRFYR